MPRERRRIAVGLALCALLAAGGVVASAERSSHAKAATRADPVPCEPQIASGSHVLELTVAGVRRIALVHIPPGGSGARLALLVALHGYGGNGRAMESYSGFSGLADSDGFEVAYPSSHGLAWNTTGASRQPRDIAFLRTLIGALERDDCADPGRVFIAGVSNGGGMAALAGCQLSARIIGFASVAGAYAGQPPCRPSKPISVLEIHGTADQIVPYDGNGTEPSVESFVRGWARREHCASTPSTHAIAPRTTEQKWSRCAGGETVAHIRILRGRHQWPGATPPDPGPPATICASCVIWSFFERAGAG